MMRHKAQQPFPGACRAPGGRLPWRLPLFTLLAALLLALPCRAGEPSPVGARPVRTMAVMPFDSLGGPEDGATGSGLGRMASEYLTAALARSAAVAVVERAKIAHVLDELEFGPSGKGAAGVAQKLGLMAGADAVVVGSVSSLRGELRLDCRAVSVADGSVLASASAFSDTGLKSLSRAADQVAAVLVRVAAGPVQGREGKAGSLSVSVAARSGEGGELSSVMPGDTLLSGTQYKVVLTPHQDGYAYVFQVDSHGGVFQLFPMESFGNTRLGNANPVKAGDTAVLPARDKAFVLDSSPGQERILVYFSPDPDPRLEAIGASLRKGRPAGGVKRELLHGAVRSRGLGAIITDQSLDISWTGGAPLPLKAKSFGLEPGRGAFMLDFNHQ